MEYRHFHVSRIGAMHIRYGLPCQDASCSGVFGKGAAYPDIEEVISSDAGESSSADAGDMICADTVEHSCSDTSGTVWIAAVADGHGNRKHFRSERGAAAACRTAIRCIREILAQNDRPAGASAPDHADLNVEQSPDEFRRMQSILSSQQLEILKQNICVRWKEEVLRDYAEHPWTEEELEEAGRLYQGAEYLRLLRGEDVLLAYGTTLCAVFANEQGWAAIQLGDGSFTLIQEEGTYVWPMPESKVNEGNRTASLCMMNPMIDFRHCSGSGHPAALLVYTDGIEKAFPPQGEQLVGLLHRIWKDTCIQEPGYMDLLARELDLVTSRYSPNGDDVSIAGLVAPQKP